MAKKKILHIPAFRMNDSGSKGIKINRLDPEIDISGEHSIASPHRDDHYMLVVIEQGKLNGNIDFEEIGLEGPFLMMVFPGQVHLLTPQTPLYGWIIDVDRAMIDQEMREDLETRCKYLLPLHQSPSDAAFQHILKLLNVMQDLYNQPLDTRHKAIAALLISVLHIINGLALNITETASRKKNRPQQIKQQFLALLYQHYSEWKKPSEYAAKLTVSTAHLNDTLKQLTGRSTMSIIQEHCVREAERLLQFTDLSTKEISYQLGYPNPSHFIAIFKSQKGITPMQYRSSVN
ncbi:helix-turn-helix domain-containing protein [Chitinophaga filiformis]|uniref:AraC family transcriptional regulator n=1 Tax=Chitinophaga filiformis TaxID=104663 RepID=A0ABY4HZ75_CHIFI|nr:AraC family transcriptional regulator [Chitinophaga filiformis]UPK68439.1 AraC family transcriptional regulator [Chitinophaga filiformis]